MLLITDFLIFANDPTKMLKRVKITVILFEKFRLILIICGSTENFVV